MNDEELESMRPTNELMDWLGTREDVCAPLSHAAAAMGLSTEEVRKIANVSYWLDIHMIDGIEHVLMDGE